MKSIRASLLLACASALLAVAQAATTPPPKKFGAPRPPPAPPATEFLGWDYARLGYTLSPGEELNLLFRNNRSTAAAVPVAWRLTRYAGEQLAQGNAALDLPPGQTGHVPIALPPDLADGAYFVRYTLSGAGPGAGREQPFYFDYRRPVPDALLTLNLVALVETMDGEGWVRMMFGPLARHVNVRNDLPASPAQRIDAVVVIAETLKAGDPRLARLQTYVREGGKMLLFGKPAPALAELLPVRVNAERPRLDVPARLQTLPAGPWQGFQPEAGPTHYGVRAAAKDGSTLLAQWGDGTPAVVSHTLGKGQVVFVGAGSDQVWQPRPSLEGADELGLRLIYWLTGGERAVAAMLARAERLHRDEEAARIAIRDRVFAHLSLPPPRDFVVVSRHNVGRPRLAGRGGRPHGKHRRQRRRLRSDHARFQFRRHPDAR